eukprot:356163-Chlamydomonas_euryale.AAC.5
MQADRAARDEEERLINLLRLEEMEEKRRQEELAKRAQAEALRAEIFAANEEQKRIKIAREAQYAAEEAAYRVELMARFAEQGAAAPNGRGDVFRCTYVAIHTTNPVVLPLCAPSAS